MARSAAARQGLAAAAAAHLPLAALRLRAAWLHAVRRQEGAGDATRLRAGSRPRWPGRCRHSCARQLESACQSPPARVPMPAPADAALGRSARAARIDPAPPRRSAPRSRRWSTALCRRLRAATVVIVTLPDDGATWCARAARGPGSRRSRVGHGRRRAGQLRARAPAECAAPIRFGGETIGAVACRWSAGAAVDLRARRGRVSGGSARRRREPARAGQSCAVAQVRTRPGTTCSARARRPAICGARS